MPDASVVSDGEHRRGPSSAYLDDMTAYLRRLALGGRGEDVRGRNLLALHVLETAYAHGWLAYRPNRDVGRWLVMLLDLVGTRVGMHPEARLRRTLGAFLDDARELGLWHLADITQGALLGHIADRFGWPELALAPFGPHMSVGTALWHAGFRTDAYRSQVHFEKHSQGKLIRRKIGASLDEQWAQAARDLLGDARPTSVHVLAVLPPSFAVVLEQVQSALQRVDEALEGAPFAVFYALVTDAARSGRRWEPPPAFVDGMAYSRDDFECSVGRSLPGSASRKARYRRSVALAELGLSSFFPATIALVDDWLTRCACSELWVEPPPGVHAGGESWLDLARAQMEVIEDFQWGIYASVTDTLGGSRPTRPGGPR